MNTKQAEELTGISRQNIRYYERQGLLEPARENGNAYRDYSREDIRRLKLIKMLRMLDMPLKEIEGVLQGEEPLKEAAARQQDTLLKQKRQLQAAIEVCGSIHKDNSTDIDVDGYLDKMENMSRDGGVFAKIVDDYKQVAQEEQQRKFTFYVNEAVNTSGRFREVLQDYAAEQGIKFKMMKPGMYPEFTLDGVTYTAARILEDDEETKKATSQIVCMRENKNSVKKSIPKKRINFYQGIYSIGVNISRHRWKSILNLTISLLIVLVMAFYLGNLTSTKKQLDELPQKLPVSAEVWNVCGEANGGLFIPERVIDAVYQSSYAKDIAEGAQLVGQLQKVDGGNVDDCWIQGINRLECINGLQEQAVTWAKGWDWNKFQESQNVCILNSVFSKDNSMQLEDQASFVMDRYILTLNGLVLEREPLDKADVKVVGIGSLGSLNEEQLVPDILFPLDEVKRLYAKNDKKYFASSLSFIIKNPMQMNKVKQQLKEAGLKTVVPGSNFSYAGAGLRVEDGIFIEAATSLEKSLSLLEGFLPFVLLVVIMVGYIVPHLLLQGRREEYAIMRALGTSKRRCTTVFFTEHILLAALGGAGGAIAGIVFHAADFGSIAIVWAMFLVCYALGAAVSIWMFGRFSIAAVLSHRD